MKSASWKRLVAALLAANLIVSGGIIAYLALGAGGASGAAEAPSSIEAPFPMTDGDKYVLHIGTNDKDTYTQQIPLDEAKRIVNEICSRHVDGYTVQEAEGGWLDDNGVLTQEQTLVYSFESVDECDLIALMDEVLESLNQASILVEHASTTYCYYSG